MSQMINAKLWIPRNEPLPRSCSRDFSVQERKSSLIGFTRVWHPFFGDRFDHRAGGTSRERTPASIRFLLVIRVHLLFHDSHWLSVLHPFPPSPPFRVGAFSPASSATPASPS